MASLFSKIVSGDIPCYKVAEDENYLAFLDINPVAKGHTLVIPKIETDYFFDLADEELCGIILFSKKVARALRTTIDCKRIGVTVIGLEVPHAHIHLIPISGMMDMNFDMPKLQFSTQEFKSLAQIVRETFDYQLR